MIESIDMIVKKKAPTKNTAQEIKLLDDFFGFLGIIQNQPLPLNLDHKLIGLYSFLKNNKFEEANLFVENNSFILQEIFLNVPITKLPAFFIFSLRKKLTFIANYLWYKSTSIVKNYFNGNEITVSIPCYNEQEVKIETTVLSITIFEWVENFKAALIGNFAEIALSMWENNPSYRDYFIGNKTKVVTSNNNNNLVLQEKTPDTWEVITNFQYTLFGPIPEIATQIWRNNAYLTQYYTAIEIPSFIQYREEYLQIKTFKISDADMSAILDRVRSINAEEILNDISKQETKKSPYISSSVITNFKNSLENNHIGKKDIKSDWKKNQQLRDYFTGKETLVLENEKTNASKVITKKIALPEIIQFFKSILKRKISVIIETIFEYNHELKDYLCNTNNKKHLSPFLNKSIASETTALQEISTEDQLEFFILALDSCNQNVIDYMWSKNSFLPIIISELDEKKLIFLTMKVLASNKTNKVTPFIKDFLNRIIEKTPYKEKILRECLSKTTRKKHNDINQFIISQLKSCSSSLESTKTTSSLPHTSLSSTLELSTSIEKKDEITSNVKYDTYFSNSTEDEEMLILLKELLEQDKYPNTTNTDFDSSKEISASTFRFFLPINESGQKRKIEDYDGQSLQQQKK